MLRHSLLVLVIALGVAPGLAVAGEVNGQMALTRPPERSASADLYGKYSSTESVSIAPFVGVVALFSTTGTHALEPGAVPVVDQKGLAFHPAVLAVQAGQDVKFLNSDPVFHNIFSLSPVKKFDLGRYSRGSSKTLTFDRAGVVQYFCDIHPEMNGVIVVLETPFFTVTDTDGVYSLKNVPAGTYTVSVWTPTTNKVEPRGKVTVPETGSVTFSPDAP